MDTSDRRSAVCIVWAILMQWGALLLLSLNLVLILRHRQTLMIMGEAWFYFLAIPVAVLIIVGLLCRNLSFLRKLMSNQPFIHLAAALCAYGLIMFSLFTDRYNSLLPWGSLFAIWLLYFSILGILVLISSQELKLFRRKIPNEKFIWYFIAISFMALFLIILGLYLQGFTFRFFILAAIFHAVAFLSRVILEKRGLPPSISQENELSDEDGIYNRPLRLAITGLHAISLTLAVLFAWNFAGVLLSPSGEDTEIIPFLLRLYVSASFLIGAFVGCITQSFKQSDYSIYTFAEIAAIFGVMIILNFALAALGAFLLGYLLIYILFYLSRRSPIGAILTFFLLFAAFTGGTYLFFDFDGVYLQGDYSMIYEYVMYGILGVFGLELSLRLLALLLPKQKGSLNLESTKKEAD